MTTPHSGDNRQARGDGDQAAVRGVQVDEEPGVSIHVSDSAGTILRYIYGDTEASRPYIYPLNGPGGIPVTRAWPMAQDRAPSSTDHPHHRSVWIAHGDVNGVDNWSDEPGHGYTRRQSTDVAVGGPAAGRFAVTSLWVTESGEPLLTEILTVTAWAQEGRARLLDFDVRLAASHGDVRFGDTKEGGLLSFRVAPSMAGECGGAMLNANGAQGEAATWGKPAPWLRYSGTVAGGPAGIAVLHHPASFRHPTHWHVRDYGLMTANPFGYAAFTGGREDGAYLLPADAEILSHYRVILYTGELSVETIGEHYRKYAADPPSAFDTRSYFPGPSG